MIKNCISKMIKTDENLNVTATSVLEIMRRTWMTTCGKKMEAALWLDVEAFAFTDDIRIAGVVQFRDEKKTFLLTGFPMEDLKDPDKLAQYNSLIEDECDYLESAVSLLSEIVNPLVLKNIYERIFKDCGAVINSDRECGRIKTHDMITIFNGTKSDDIDDRIISLAFDAFRSSTINIATCDGFCHCINALKLASSMYDRIFYEALPIAKAIKGLCETGNVDDQICFSLKGFNLLNMSGKSLIDDIELVVHKSRPTRYCNKRGFIAMSLTMKPDRKSLSRFHEHGIFSKVKSEEISLKHIYFSIVTLLISRIIFEESEVKDGWPQYCGQPGFWKTILCNNGPVTPDSPFMLK